MPTEVLVQKSHVVENCFELILLNNGIVTIEFEEDFYEMKVAHLKQIESGMKVLGDGRKLPFFFKAKDFMQADEEAVNYSRSPESGKYTLANAVLVDNSAKRLMYNFYFNIKKPHVLTKAFKSKEEAFNWLLSLKNKS